MPFRVKKEELVARAAVIAHLITLLEVAGIMHAIIGMGGIGKSLVSAAVAKELQLLGIVQCCFFMQADSFNSLREELVRIGRGYVQSCAFDATDDDAVEAATKFFCTTAIQWVVVLDDVRDWSAVEPLVPTGPNGRILVTSNVDLSSYGLPTTELALFTTDESLSVSSRM